MKQVERVSRVREGGRQVTICRNGEERIEAFRKIVSEGSFAIIDNVGVDLFSASAVVRVYDAINEGNQIRFRELPVQRMAAIALQLCSVEAS